MVSSQLPPLSEDRKWLLTCHIDFDNAMPGHMYRCKGSEVVEVKSGSLALPARLSAKLPRSAAICRVCGRRATTFTSFSIDDKLDHRELFAYQHSLLRHREHPFIPAYPIDRGDQRSLLHKRVVTATTFSGFQAASRR